MRVLLLACVLASVAWAERPATELNRRIRAAKERVFPALVHIINVEEVFVGGRRQRNVSTGSGFLIDAQGHIVTNYHVAGRGRVRVVTLASRRKAEATLVAADPHTDLAVLKVDPKVAFPDGDAKFAVFGDSARLEVGDFVMAMGSPLSLSRSVSFGILSCLDRTLGRLELDAGEETGRYHTWLQTDAAINPGNSGGPLVDLAGEVVGVNTRASLLANNIGFAIPSNVVRDVVEALLAHGTVPRAYVGLRLQPFDELEQTSLGGGAEGVLVAAVDAESPAERAGVRPGDFLVAVAGEPCDARFAEEIPPVYDRIAKLPVGRPAALQVRRGDTLLEIEVTPEQLGRQLGREVEIGPWGITVRAITARMRLAMSLEDTRGVLVTGVRAGGPAAGLLEPGDVVREAQGEAVEGLDDLLELAVRSRRGGDEVVRVVFRRGSVLDLTAFRVPADGAAGDAAGGGAEDRPR